MKIEISNTELYDILKDGSTNQKHFINTIEKYNLDVDNVFDIIENTFIELEIKDDIRGLINGGVLYIDNKTNNQFLNIELDDNIYLIIE